MQVRNAKAKDKGYRSTDTGGLHLFVTPKGIKSWRQRFDFAGKEQILVLGVYPEVGLAAARVKRDDAKRRLANGEDPRLAPSVAALPTLENVTRRWHTTNASRWKPHHAANILSGLEREVFPTLGTKAIRDLKAPAVLEMLRSIQSRGSIETAHRIRGRLSDVFAFAIGEGLCETNPADAIKAAMAPIPKGGHRAAVITLEAARDVLPKAEETPAYPVTRLAMRLLALTAVRPSEVGGMLWNEVEGDLWRIPKERMKMDREHLVPLSRQALEILSTVKILSGRVAFVFPGASSSKIGLSKDVLGLMLRRAGFSGVHVPHGWRASFSTIMNERYPSDRLAIDLMLAHTSGGAKGLVEAAYNRAEHMARRREIAQEWADLLLDGLPPAMSLLGGSGSMAHKKRALLLSAFLSLGGRERDQAPAVTRRGLASSFSSALHALS